MTFQRETARRGWGGLQPRRGRAVSNNHVVAGQLSAFLTCPLLRIIDGACFQHYPAADTFRTPKPNTPRKPYFFKNVGTISKQPAVIFGSGEENLNTHTSPTTPPAFPPSQHLVQQFADESAQCCQKFVQAALARLRRSPGTPRNRSESGGVDNVNWYSVLQHLDNSVLQHRFFSRVVTSSGSEESGLACSLHRLHESRDSGSFDAERHDVVPNIHHIQEDNHTYHHITSDNATNTTYTRGIYTRIAHGEQ